MPGIRRSPWTGALPGQALSPWTGALPGHVLSMERNMHLPWSDAMQWLVLI
ncbi:MAG: hypothetical protein P1P82_09945 [Bacteroidales bacterium]|nr:hypothetical protein [Bacteroidales bacterium]